MKQTKGDKTLSAQPLQEAKLESPKGITKKNGNGSNKSSKKEKKHQHNRKPKEESNPSTNTKNDDADQDFPMLLGDTENSHIPEPSKAKTKKVSAKSKRTSPKTMKHGKSSSTKSKHSQKTSKRKSRRNHDAQDAKIVQSVNQSLKKHQHRKRRLHPHHEVPLAPDTHTEPGNQRPSGHPSTREENEDVLLEPTSIQEDYNPSRFTPLLENEEVSVEEPQMNSTNPTNDHDDHDIEKGPEPIIEAYLPEPKGKNNKRKTDLEKEVVLEGVVANDGVSGKSRRFLVLLFCLFLALVVTAIVLSITLRNTRNKNKSTPTSVPSSLGPTTLSPTDVPTSSPTEVQTAPPTSRRFHEIVQIIDAFFEAEMIPKPVPLDDWRSPQYAAAMWMADDDIWPFDLQFNDYTDTGEIQHFYQRYGLATFYFATEGNTWSDQCNFLSSDHVCDWNCQHPIPDLSNTGGEIMGVVCGKYLFPSSNDAKNLVVSLELVKNNLGGFIPKEIGALPTLKLLNLFDNQIGGTIPFDQFDGLWDFSAPYNNFVGSISDDIGELSFMTNLWIAGNSLTGSLPNEIADMKLLQTLSIDDNSLSGQIPPLFLQSSELYFLNLNHNRFDGTLPLVVTAPLVAFTASHNQLTGNLPASIGIVSTLKTLAFQNNQLKGSIPFSFSKLTNLNLLDLSYNSLSGSIDSLWSLKNLEYLSVGINNGFTGTLSSEISSMQNMLYFDFSENELSGTIPTEIGSMTNLSSLTIALNKLTGQIPTEIDRLTSLDILLLNGNYLSGSLDRLCDSVLDDDLTTLFHSDCFDAVDCYCCSICCELESGDIDEWSCDAA